MALPTTLNTLDYDRRGRPYAHFSKPPRDNSYSLDYETRGTPYALQLEIIPQDPNTITVIAVDPEVVVVRRKFPNKRQEMVGETQIKQIAPLFGAQYVLYLP